MSRSAAQIIDENGGPAVFAEKVGRTPGAVRVWKHRNAFPRDAWPEILGFLPELTLSEMIEMEKAAKESATSRGSSNAKCHAAGLSSQRTGKAA